MIVIDTSVVIDRPVGMCFDFMARGYFDYLRRWNSSVVEVKKLTDGPVEAGTRGRQTHRIRGKDHGRSIVVTQLQPDALFELKVAEPEGDERHYLCRYTFKSEEGNRTRILVHFELDWNQLHFKLFRPFVRRSVARSIDMDIQRRLKSSIEEMVEPSGIMGPNQPMVVKPTRGTSKQ